jgi:hypothetical protein
MALKDTKIIFEQAAVDTNVKILEESALPGGQYKMIFKMRLQEAEVINNNKRVYPAATLEKVYEQLKDKATSRALLMEMDHPQPQGDQASKIKRSSTISIQNACAVIRELIWDGNAIYGVIETLTNSKGMDLYCLLKDNVTIGSSLRAFGSTRQRSDGVVEVLPDDIKALTYDIVSNPSHASSIILEFLPENENIGTVVDELKLNVLEESHKMKNSALIEEANFLNNQLQTGAVQKTCLGNICTIAPIEEAIEYIVEKVVAEKFVPKVKIKSL